MAAAYLCFVRPMQRSSAFLARSSEKCYALLRIIVGLLFACHGAQKLFGLMGGRLAIHSSIGLAAGLIEFVAGVLVAFGFCARAAAFLASGEMAVAYFMVCASQSLWPIANGGEMPCSIVSSFSTSSFTAPVRGASILFVVPAANRPNSTMLFRLSVLLKTLVACDLEDTHSMKTHLQIFITTVSTAAVLFTAAAFAQKPSPTLKPFQMPDMSAVWSQMAHAMFTPERAVELAHFQKLYYDALVKEGFTKEEALSIIRANQWSPR